MKRLLLSFLIFAHALVLAAAPMDVSVSAEGAYTSRYVFRGIKVGEEAFQPAINASIGPIELGFWANHPAESEENIERDYAVGFSFSQAGFDWRLGGVRYDYPQAEVPFTRHTFEFSAGGSRVIISKGRHELVATGTVFYDMRLEALTLEAGVVHTLSLREGISIITTLGGGHVSAYDLTPDAGGPKAADAYSYAAAKTEMKLTVGTRGFARVGIQWDTTANLNGGGADLSGNFSRWVAVGVEW